MSLAPMEADLRRVGLTLAGLSAALWALTALVGRRVCRRALRPVAEMAAAAAVMTAAESDQGLPSPGTGDELEHLARSFNGLIRRLRDAMARQERFAGDASHQLRTPLTALISEVELACRRDRPADEYRATLRAILGDAVRLRQIVEALLFLARADLAADRLDLEPVELSTWLPSYLERWAHHERGCDIRHEVADRPPLAVAAHSPLLGQLLDNLLDNACKYSPPGTPVVVRLGRDAAAGEVRLSVEDAGEGLTAEELAHAFEPFYHAPRAHRLGKPGVGLGLAVAQRIASAFDGRIDAESHPGRGARFIARFPEAST